MRILDNTIIKLISTTIVIAIVLITGHFCLSQSAHTSIEHAHTHSESNENDINDECCRDNNLVNINSVITKKTFNNISDNPAFTDSLHFSDSYSLQSKQSLPYSDTPAPNQFLKQSFRTLLC
jgi:hypothetical protein